MSLRFDDPWWFALAAIILPLALVAWRVCVGMSTVRRLSVIALRAALVTLLCALLAGTTSIRTTNRVAVVAVVDVSGSVRSFAPPLPIARGPEEPAPATVLDSVRRYLLQTAGQRGPEDLLGLIIVDGTAVALATPSAGPVLERDLDVSVSEGTDLPAAIRLAASILPPDAARRILLFSDGVTTTGDPLEAAATLASAGATIPIDVVPLNYTAEREVIVERLDAPSNAPAGAVITARVTLLATAPAKGTLRLLADEQEVDANGAEPGFGRPITLSPGRRTELINLPLNLGRVHRLRAVFEPAVEDGVAPADTLALNNTAETLTVTPGRGSVLILDGVGRANPDAPGATLARTLREEGLDVDLIAPDSLPADLLRLQQYDLVILQNVSAETLGDPAQERLTRFVSDLGGGLVMIGGPDSFGAGGYMGSPLEPILPVRLDLPDRLVMPTAAVVMVIDNSGSMDRTIGGSIRTQQDVANEGAAAAIRTLDQGDLLGVITFNSRYHNLIPLERNRDPKAAVQSVLSISPGGGTNMLPALEEARLQLRQAKAQLKHIIVLSDGLSEGSRRIPEVARAIAADQIKVSTIALGDAADAEGLATLAEIGGGEYFRVTDPTILPRVFLRAVRVVRTPMIREIPFTPIVFDRASPIIQGDANGPMPPLGGLVLTQARTEPTVSTVLVSSDGEPVLAHWPVGLGQVAAFTSDAHQWAAQWLGWPGYRRLWAQVARAIARPTGQRQAELSTELVGDQLRIRLEAADDQNQPIDGLAAPASVYHPDGRRLDLRLAQVGPGQYEAVALADQTGTYVVTVSPRQGARALAPAIAGAVQPRGLEFRTLASDPDTLRRLADTTGGRVLDPSRPQDARLFDRDLLKPVESRTPLWPPLLLATLAVALLDIATRRVAWDRALSREFGRSVREEAARAVRDRGAQAARTLSALREQDKPRESGAALGADDAAEVVLRERQRRREARAQASYATPPADPTATPPATPRAADDAAPAEAPPSEGGLLAAKRRARERFDEDATR